MRTHIGFGSPNRQDTQKAHGAPLGPDEVRLTKEAYGWDPDKTFYIPDEALALFRAAVPRGEELAADWDERFAAYAAEHPDARRASCDAAWPASCPTAGTRACRRTPTAPRPRHAQRLPERAPGAQGPLPELFGGAADLSESNLTDLKGAGELRAPTEPGRNIRFGVREHAMGGIANGIAYHGGFLPYVATFLTFSDYMRGSVRLAALTGLHVVYVWTHDSVGLGEDGPTHQPVEHYAALRAMPNLTFMRPGDPNEAVAAWRVAIERRDGPGGAGADAPEAARPAGHRGSRPPTASPRRLRAGRRGRPRR